MNTPGFALPHYPSISIDCEALGPVVELLRAARGYRETTLALQDAVNAVKEAELALIAAALSVPDALAAADEEAAA